MFRRRTDQVYATLQQVQRRISEQSGQPPAPRPTAVAPAIRTPLPAVAQPGGAPARPAARITTPLPGDSAHPVAPAPQTAFPPTTPPYLSGSQPAGVQLSVQSMITLALVVMVLCGVCLGLGWWLGKGDGGRTIEPSRPLVEQTQIRVDDSRPALAVIVVYRDPDASKLEALRGKAREYDKWLMAQPGGWQPGFGVRQTADGGVQLFYGQRADGGIGIPANQGNKDLAAFLKRKGLAVTWEPVKG